MIKFLLLTLLSLNTFAQITDTDKQDLINKNLIKNSGGENNKSRWTASAGTFVHTTTAAQVASGKGALSWDAAADGDTLRSTAIAIPQGAYGNNGVVFCSFKGASAVTHEIGVYDGTNEIALTAITSTTGTFSRSASYFIFPSSGNIQLQVKAKANEPALYIDDCYLGLADGSGLQNISQSEIYGVLKYNSATSCAWSTSSGTYASFSADSDCNSTTVTGRALTPTTVIPAVRFASLAPGKYKLTAYFGVTVSSSGNAIALRFNDGTTAGRQVQHIVNGSGTNQMVVLSDVYEYTSAKGTTTFEIQGLASATATIDVQANFRDFMIVVERFPLDTQQALTFNSAPWLVDATISGAQINLGTGSVTSWTDITDSGLTLVNNTSKGSDPSVQIGCSSTNAPTGTTCSSGSESMSVSFEIPRAGLYEACTNFSDAVGNVATAGAASYYKIVETATNSQTIIQSGGETGSGVSSSSIANGVGGNRRFCGTFNFSSVGRKMLRAFYQRAGGDYHFINIQNGTPELVQKWTVRPLTQNFPAPIVNNSITSNNSGALRLETAYLTYSAGTPSISRQTGTWISSITDSGLSDITLNLAAGAFSSAPDCTCSVVGTNGYMCSINTATSTSAVRIKSYPYYDTAYTTPDVNMSVICIGAK